MTTSMRIIVLFLLVGMLMPVAFAGLQDAEGLYKKGKRGIRQYPQLVEELLHEELYFASVPFIKEYLITVGKVKSSSIDSLIDRIITNVGVQQFEVLPINILQHTKAPIVKYILAKKYFRLGKYRRTLRELNATIPKGHAIKPFALMLEGSAYSLLGQQANAIAAYKECVSSSESYTGRIVNQERLKQLQLNRDYCVIGIPRAEFAAEKFEAANIDYQKLPKSSFAWPEILFEEAWNSFYLEDYNRALGKLVTYEAPVFEHVFNPELDVLRALAYMELCLWKDAQKIVDDFYKKYQKSYQMISRFLQKKGQNYKYFYLAAKSRKEGQVRGSRLLNRLMLATIHDARYKEMNEAFLKGKKELEIVNSMAGSRFKRVLQVNLKEALLLQRNLVGAYVRKSLMVYKNQLSKALENMSYIKLEVLSRRKGAVYGFDSQGKGKRGDFDNLKRTEKQYFWNFNGEFWADELGDYVFSLKSQCK